MNISLRFSLVLGSLIIGFSLVLVLLHQFSLRAEERYWQDFHTEQSTHFQHWLNSDNRSWLHEATAMAEDLSVIEKLDGGLVQLPKSVEAGTSDLAVQNVWLLRPDSTVDAVSSGGIAPGEADLFNHPEFVGTALRNDRGWFYFSTEKGLFQAFFAAVRSRPSDKPQSWILLVREWNRKQLEYLEGLAGGKLSLAITSPTTSSKEGSYRLTSELLDWRGLSLRTLVLEVPFPDPSSNPTAATAPTLLMVAFGVFSVLALAISLQSWVLRPLRWIQQSLTTGELAPINPLLARTDEFGGVANLLASSMEQRLALHESEQNLQQVLQERIRLGRDLHDGVIQSLYAAGMRLASIKSRLNLDQGDVTATLDQSRAALNETILDLRNFINGLEPEAHKQQSFTEAVANLLEFAQEIQSVKTTCQIDEELASRLSISQRANVLQITRETVSNALRHGEATELAVTLQAKGPMVEYVIRDNGRGFDPKSGDSKNGLGLENLTNRARDIGAELFIDSQPGQGTEMRLTLNPSSATT